MNQSQARVIAKHEGRCIDCLKRRAKSGRSRCRKCLATQRERAKVRRQAEPLVTTAGALVCHNGEQERERAAV